MCIHAYSEPPLKGHAPQEHPAGQSKLHIILPLNKDTHNCFGPKGICSRDIVYNYWYTHCIASLVPGPLPDVISQPWRKKDDFSPQLRDKIWEWPGNEASVCHDDMT